MRTERNKDQGRKRERDRHRDTKTAETDRKRQRKRLTQRLRERESKTIQEKGIETGYKEIERESIRTEREEKRDIFFLKQYF